MAFHVEWMNQDETILLTTLEAGWQWAEFLGQSSAVEKAHLDAVIKPVYLLKHLKGQISRPPLGWIQTFQGTGIIDHPRCAAYIVISQNSLIKTLAAVYAKVQPEFGRKTFVVRDIEEALQKVDTLEAAL